MLANTHHAALAIPLRAIRSLFSVLLTNPFPLVAGGIAAWLMLQLGGGVLRLQAEGHVWEPGAMLSCVALGTVLGMTVVLAAAHVLLSLRAGWGSARRDS